MSERDDHNFKERCNALYSARLAAIYHRRRERFFENGDRVVKLISVAGGSAALTRILAGFEFDAALAALIAFSSAIGLVFSLPDRARRHSELAAAFKRLEADILRVGEDPPPDAVLAGWQARIAEIEADEPAPMRRLVAICQAELNQALGRSQDGPVVSTWARLTAQFWS